MNNVWHSVCTICNGNLFLLALILDSTVLGLLFSFVFNAVHYYGW